MQLKIKADVKKVIDSKNLILLDKEEAERVLKIAIRSKLNVYIIDTGRNIPFLLSIGDLEKIRRSIPRRTEVMLEIPHAGTCIGRFERAGYEDLRIVQSQYDDIFKAEQKNEVNETERRSLYKMILGMAITKYDYDPKETRNSATGTNKNSIKADLETCGLSMDDDTIRKFLREAYEMHNPQMKK